MNAPRLTVAAAAALLDDVRLLGAGEGTIVSLTCDSRDVVPGSLFAAIDGSVTDGHRFIDAAVEAGAGTVLVQRLPENLPDGVSVMVVPDSRRALARLAAAYHGEPSLSMALAGITATIGKTTITYLLESMLRRTGNAAGAIGTTGVRIGGRVRQTSHTTPDGPELQQALAEMRNAGVEVVVMEVSSHALEQGRAVGCHLDVAAFTNLTRDHLDYHGDMESYFEAKSRVVTELLERSAKPRKRLVINADDPWADRFADLWPHVIRVSADADSDADIRPAGLSFDLDGIRGALTTPRGELTVRSALVGSFNAVNVALSVGIAEAMDLPQQAVEKGIRALRRIPGRLEPVRLPVDQGGPADLPRVFVDYAHTSDALERVLDALRPLVPGELITVFGCGGDRDRGKRPMMGQAAAAGSDRVVVTSDNPRGEDPMAIIEEILPGVRRTDTPHEVQPDRRAAIHGAVGAAGPDDLVLIAGKGHERVQVVGERALAFEDQQVALDALQARGS